VSGTREGALARAAGHLESGAFLDDLRRRVAVPTESQERARAPELRRYLDDEIAPWLKQNGYTSEVLANPDLTFHVTGFSKCVSPGLRMGYVLAPRALANDVAGAIRINCWSTRSPPWWRR
jgi:DNA-binding transcriptional MocR family regulator